MTETIKVFIDARLTDNQFGGTKTYIEGLVKVLRAQNLEKIEITWFVLPFSHWWKKHLVVGDQHITDRGVFRWAGRLLRRLFSEKFLMKILVLTEKKEGLGPKVFKVRGLDLDEFHLLHFPIQDAFPTDKPYVYHPHDLQHFYYPEYFNKFAIHHRNMVWKKYADNAAKIVCASRSVKDDLIKFWNIDPDKIEIIHLPSPRQHARGQSMSISEKNSILCVSNFWKHKNHETLIKSISLLTQRFPQVKVTMVGSGPELDNNILLSKGLGVFENITFSGAISDEELSELYDSHEVICIPSKFEAASFPLLEAMSRNKKIVASSIPPFLELNLKSIGFYGDPCDEFELATCLEMALSELPKIEQRRDDYLSYLNTIDPEMIGIKFANLYREIIRNQY